MLGHVVDHRRTYLARTIIPRAVHQPAMKDQQVPGLHQYRYGGRHVVIHDLHIPDIRIRSSVGNVFMNRLPVRTRNNVQATVISVGLAYREPETNLGMAIEGKVVLVLVPWLPPGTWVFKNELGEEAIDLGAHEFHADFDDRGGRDEVMKDTVPVQAEYLRDALFLGTPRVHPGE